MSDSVAGVVFVMILMVVLGVWFFWDTLQKEKKKSVNRVAAAKRKVRENEMLPPHLKLHRVLVCVLAVEEQGRVARVLVPAWSTSPVWIRVDMLPPKIRRDLYSGKEFHVMVNIGAQNAGDLLFEDWEA